MVQKVFPTKKVLIFVDSREAGSEVIKKLEQYDCIIRKKMLHIADYVLSDRVAVERKRYSDFIKSIIDQRLFSQIRALAENFKKPILVIEGKEKLVGLHPNAIRGALAFIAVDQGIPILWTDSEEETAGLLYWIARREQIEEKREPAIRGKRKALSMSQQQEFLIAGLPHVSSVLAKRLLNYFKTPEKVFKAKESDLKKIESIGKIKAKNIRKVLETRYKD